MTLTKESVEQLEQSDGHWNERQSQAGRIVEILKGLNVTPIDAKLLDVGCSEGRDLEIYLEAGFDAQGLEIDPRAVEKARERNSSLRVHAGDMANLPDPFSAQQFDVIVSLNTLFYGDSFSILPKILQTLKPGGVGVVTLDEKILRLDTGQPIHELDVNKLLRTLSGVEILSKSYSEREDETPWPHRHYFYETVIRKTIRGAGEH